MRKSKRNLQSGAQTTRRDRRIIPCKRGPLSKRTMHICLSEGVRSTYLLLSAQRRNEWRTIKGPSKKDEFRAPSHSLGSAGERLEWMKLYYSSNPWLSPYSNGALKNEVFRRNKSFALHFSGSQEGSRLTRKTIKICNNQWGRMVCGIVTDSSMFQLWNASRTNRTLWDLTR